MTNLTFFSDYPITRTIDTQVNTVACSAFTTAESAARVQFYATSEVQQVHTGPGAHSSSDVWCLQ